MRLMRRSLSSSSGGENMPVTTCIWSVNRSSVKLVTLCLHKWPSNRAKRWVGTCGTINFLNEKSQLSENSTVVKESHFRSVVYTISSLHFMSKNWQFHSEKHIKGFSCLCVNMYTNPGGLRPPLSPPLSGDPYLEPYLPLYLRFWVQVLCSQFSFM
jgi:hypothetical protein